MVCQGAIHRFEKIIIVNEQDVVGRSVHALQKTLAAVIDTVEHMREIIVVLAADPIAFGSAQHPLAEFVGNYERGLLFL